MAAESAESKTDGINPDDGLNTEAQASPELMDEHRGEQDIIQPKMDKASPESSQTSPRPSSSTLHIEPALPPEPSIPPLPTVSHTIPENPYTEPSGPERPRRHRRPPDYYGVHALPQQTAIKSHGPRSGAYSKTIGSKSASSLPSASRISRVSRGSNTSVLSDLQASLLEGKKRRDELEELKRQQMEDEELDAECALIDKEARDAQQRQQEAQQKREKIVRNVATNRRIRIKEQELEAAQLVSSFIRENLLDDHPAAASAPTSSSLHDHVASTSFHDLPPSRMFTPAPVNLRYAESQDDSTPPISQIGYSNAPQIHPMLQPLQQSTVQVPTSTVQSYISPLPALSTYHAPVTRGMVQAPSQIPSRPAPVALSSVQAPNQSSSMLGPVQPTITGSLPPMQISSQPPHSVHSQPPNVTDLVLASAYGIPKPSLPVFKSGRESDFALLKMALDNLLDNHTHLTEQFKYQVLLEHLKHPGAHKSKSKQGQILHA